MEEKVMPELEANGIHLYKGHEDMGDEHRDEVMHIFLSKVLSYLQPVIAIPKTELFLEDRMLYFLIHVNAGHRLEDLKIILNIPSNNLPRFYSLSTTDQGSFIIYLDDIIRVGVQALFKHFTFMGFYSIKINRDADLHLKAEEEGEGVFVDLLERGLDMRKKGAPSRFQYDVDMPIQLVDFCREYFQLDEGEMLPVSRYLSTSDFFRFPNPKGSSLTQAAWPALRHPSLSLFGNYFEAISAKDIILHFPYQTYDYVLVFFNLAVLDRDVTEIMATFYRVAQDSHIVNALISAARNGKKVKAFVELKARFDEANNIYWAKQMADAGVEITYSIPGIKVHAKAALIKKREQGIEKKYAFFGTGNFNEKTAGIYSDMGLLTSDPGLCDELESVFLYLYKRLQPPTFEHLLVSQFGSLEKIIWLIDREITAKKEGRPSGITIKVNNLEDKEVIDKLYEASQAGVEVKLCVRSICCIKPGVTGLSEHIQLFRVVGRYLEHARVFMFMNGGEHEIFMGSADLMSRNLRHRVEVIFPVRDPQVKKQVMDFMEIQFRPANKTQKLNPDLNPIPWETNITQYCAQEAFYHYLQSLEHETNHEGTLV
jgi:polyphosphate kinase